MQKLDEFIRRRTRSSTRKRPLSSPPGSDSETTIRFVASIVSLGETEMLSRVALLGEVRSPREFIYILNSVRQAL
jgi:hypothetical protein